MASGGLIALAVTGVNVLVLPVVIIGMLAGIDGIWRAGSEPERASMALGVALWLSALVVLVSLASADPWTVLSSLPALGFFVAAWRREERLRGDRRRRWGTRQRIVLAQAQELNQRRDHLLNRPVGQPDGADSPNPSD